MGRDRGQGQGQGQGPGENERDIYDDSSSLSSSVGFDGGEGDGTTSSSIVSSVDVAIGSERVVAVGMGRHRASDTLSAGSFMDDQDLDDDDVEEGLYNGNTAYATSTVAGGGSSVGGVGARDRGVSIDSIESELPPTMAGLRLSQRARMYGGGGGGGGGFDAGGEEEEVEDLPSYREVAAVSAYRR